MTTFQMLNHQLKHMLGGIEAQKNASIQQLENFQKRIIKAMEKAQNCHKKIYQAASTMKANLVQLSENYMNLFRQGKYSATLIGKVHNQLNKFLQDICEQSLALAKKMEGKVESYIPNLKKMKEKYTQSAQKFEHYRLKLQLLKKNVEKHSLANIKQDDHQRFQRNKDKLKNAQKEHNQALLKIKKRFYEFNSEGLKDIFHDFVSIVSSVGGNIFGIAHRLSKSVIQNTANKDLIITKNIKSNSISKKSNFKSNGDLDKGDATQEKHQLLNYIVQERQISYYMKSIMEKQIIKIQMPQKINEVFARNEAINKQNQVKSFDEFKNQYTTHHLKHLSGHQKMKEPDRIEISEDLLSVEQQNENNRAVTAQDALNNDIDFSFEQSQIQQKKSQANDQKIKKNLERFNQICQQNKKNLNVPPSNQKPGDKIKSIQTFPINHLNIKPVPPKEQKTVQVHQFFNFNENKNKKDEKLSKPQEQLVKLHENLLNFDFINTPAKVEVKRTASNTNSVSNFASKNQRSGNSNPNNIFSTHNQKFQGFDFFEQQAKNLTNNYKSPVKMNEIKSSKILPKNQKANNNSFDLLNF